MLITPLSIRSEHWHSHNSYRKTTSRSHLLTALVEPVETTKPHNRIFISPAETTKLSEKNKLEDSLAIKLKSKFTHKTKHLRSVSSARDGCRFSGFQHGSWIAIGRRAQMTISPSVFLFINTHKTMRAAITNLFSRIKLLILLVSSAIAFSPGHTSLSIPKRHEITAACAAVNRRVSFQGLGFVLSWNWHPSL